ncbi:MAG: S-layer homology domain-containing protein [Clostridia bacterium]|nr:S-layer homology domain-containing protein [Clostridia bacterium]
MKYEENDIFSEEELGRLNDSLKKSENFDLPESLKKENIIEKLYSAESGSGKRKSAALRLRRIGLVAASVMILAGAVIGLTVALNRSHDTPDIPPETSETTTIKEQKDTAAETTGPAVTDQTEPPVSEPEETTGKSKDTAKPGTTSAPRSTQRNSGSEATRRPSAEKTPAATVPERTANNAGPAAPESATAAPPVPETKEITQTAKPEETSEKTEDTSIPEETSSETETETDPPAPPDPAERTVFDHTGKTASYKGDSGKVDTYFNQIDFVSTNDPLFSDVDEDIWFSKGAEFCLVNGYMINAEERNFCPDISVTRAETARVVSMICKADVMSETPEQKFSDVTAENAYVNSINWVTDNGIMSGTGDSEFEPYLMLTREQLCTVMKRVSEYLKLNTDIDADLSVYTDINQADSWATDGIKYSVGTGIVSGIKEDSFSPKTNVNRAQMSVIVKNYVTGEYTTDHVHEWSTATCTEPSHCEICGIKNGSALGHLCPDDICTRSGRCLRCKQTVEPTGHTFESVIRTESCTDFGGKYLVCSRCGFTRTLTSVLPLGHTTYDGLCTRCGKIISKTVNVYTRIRDYLAGEAEGNCDVLGKCCGAEYVYANGSRGNAYFFYDEGLDAVIFEYKYSPIDKDFEMCSGFVLRNGERTVQTYAFRADGDSYVGATGKLDPTKYVMGRTAAYETVETCTDYSYVFDLTEDMDRLFPELLKRTDELLKAKAGLNLAQIGFIIY